MISETIENFRKLVQTYINLHAYDSALFWADKVVALTNNPRDVYWLAQCMYLLKQYHRAVHLLQTRNLEKTYILCNYLTVKCLYEANEYLEALKVINLFDYDYVIQKNNTSTPCISGIDTVLFDDTPKNQTFSSILLLKGKVLEGMDNRGLAADCFKHALDYDVFCYEAFDSLIRYQMLTAVEEEELMKMLPFSDQCSMEEAEILVTLYESKLKKYHTPTEPKENESRILSNNEINKQFHRNLDTLPMSPPTLSSNPLPMLIVTPTSISTPNVARNNDKNLHKKSKYAMQIDNHGEGTFGGPLLMRLNASLDLHVAHAERLYYNCDYQQCSILTESILKQDSYHTGCMPIHIACQVELKQSNKLFSLAHNLVDLYPNLAISWFAVGCYYYITEGKSDLARRYLAKATSIDRLFGPAWLAYGHSFAIENEHDQAMAAYFKASQLMKGCHLPLLYIGLECGLTNNVLLADKFFQQAQNIAPEDPFIMHEKGVIALQNLNYEVAETNFKEALFQIKKIKKGLIPERWEPLLNNLGHTCRKLKKYEQALEYHHQALLLCPQSAATYSAIAYVYVLMGNSDQAVDWFHRALGIKRDDTFSTTMLNYVLEQLAEDKAPYPGAPNEIPNFDKSSRSQLCTTNTTLGESVEEEDQNSGIVDNEMSDMSIEVDMTDTCGTIKED